MQPPGPLSFHLKCDSEPRDRVDECGDPFSSDHLEAAVRRAVNHLDCDTESRDRIDERRDPQRDVRRVGGRVGSSS
jgi:hypothetical protein